MGNASNNNMFFQSSSTPDRKTFTVEFPMDVIFSLRWGEKELKKLNKFDRSEKVSDQLKMLTMICQKVENDRKGLLIK
jgi:hypothetical protein